MYLVWHNQLYKSMKATFYIMKTCPCNIQRLFLVVKNENFTRKILTFFLLFAQNIDCGYSLEPPRRGGSNEYPQSMFWSKKKKNRYTPVLLYKSGVQVMENKTELLCS